MIRLLGILFFVCCSFILPLEAQFEQPFNWSYKQDKDKLTASALVPKGTYLYLASTTLQLTDRNGKTIKPLDVPKGTLYEDEFQGKVEVLKGEQTYHWIFPLADAYPYKLQVDFQGCRGKTDTEPSLCYMPGQKEFTVTAVGNNTAASNDVPAAQTGKPSAEKGTAVLPTELSTLLDQFDDRQSRSGVLDKKEFIAFLQQKESEQNILANKNIIILILIILVGGLGLNLTPCILPMIPINLAIIGAGINAKSKFSGFFRGGIYGAGIAMAYGILGLIVIFTGAKFGSLNSLPWFNFAIAVIFTVLALAMFDLVTIDFSKYSANLGPSEKNKGKVISVFFMGIIAALLAGACVAPVVITVLLHSASLYKSGNMAGLLLPFLLGIGMALPWPLAGGGLSFLPKPGKWMMMVKKVFGVLIIIVAIHYGYKGVIRWQEDTGTGTVKATDSIQVLEAGLKKAMTMKKPVVIDFWASWCANCKVMENSTFKEPEVKEILNNEFVFIKFQAEDVNARQTRAILDYFEVMGLPTYVIIKPKK